MTTGSFEQGRQGKSDVRVTPACERLGGAVRRVTLIVAYLSRLSLAAALGAHSA
jgi:hypothetical protein